MNDKKTAELKIEEILKSNNPRVKEIGKGILKQIGDKKSKKRLQEMEYQEMQEELKKAEERNKRKK